MRWRHSPLFSALHTLRVLARTELALQTRGSVLGLFWLLVEPLFLFLVYSYVFGFILSVRFDYNATDASFSELLFAALIPFSVFQSSVITALQSLRVNKNTLLGSSVSPLVFVLVPTATSIVAELFGLLALIAWVLYQGAMPFYLLAILPLLITVRLVLSAAISLFASILVVFIRDFDFLVRMAMTLLLFATPIIYPASLVPSHLQWIYEMNPFYHLVEAYRHVLILGELPGVGFYLVLFVAVGLLFISIRFFNATIERAKEFL
jgi:lipopolysaccharide transport system permease protein